MTINNIYRNRMSIKENPACADIWINECLDKEQKRKRAEVKAVVHLAQSLNKEARAVADSNNPGDKIRSPLLPHSAHRPYTRETLVNYTETYTLTWSIAHCQVMVDLVNLKAQIPKIREFLVKTGDRDLVESTGDTYWGCGASFRSARVQENKTTGKNKLGKIWTTCRNQIMAVTAAPKPTHNNLFHKQQHRKTMSCPS